MKKVMEKQEISAILEECRISEVKAKQCIRLLEEKGFLDRIQAFCPMKKGMTNNLFFFATDDGEYLIRIPGEGSEYLLDRVQEANVYRKLADRHITDRSIFIDPAEGFKITEYIDNAHTCNAGNPREVHRCIQHLKSLHDQAIVTEKTFDVFEMLERYEKHCRHDPGRFVPAYAARRQEVMELKALLDRLPRKSVLCHVDPVSDNFLIRGDDVFLIDWEYASQADPDMDIAMFCIYANYNREQVDRVIDFYYTEKCEPYTRQKVYCYIASCALLWVVWCEIKRDAGILFEEYEKDQYDYIHSFYEIARNMDV